MKRILFFLLLGVCLGLKAADRDDSKYLAGAVPEVNGVVTFEKQFKVPGQTDDQIRNTLMTYVKESLVKNAIEGLRTRVISDGTTGEPICARIEEMMVFKNKPLSHPLPLPDYNQRGERKSHYHHFTNFLLHRRRSRRSQDRNLQG